MNARRLAARATAITATTVVVATGVATASWAAVGTVSVTSGTPVLNDATHALVLSGTGPYAPGPTATVKLTRHGSVAAEDIISVTGTATAGDVHTITASVPYANANPGAYDVDITQGAIEDACSSCVTVAAFTPAVTSVSPDLLGGGTTGGGFQNFVISGQGFTKGLYAQCTLASCSGPSVAVYKTGTTTSDPDVTLTQTYTSANPPACCAPTPTTPTTVTLRIALTGTDAAHADDVVVTNSDGKSGTCTACLSLLPQPTITSVLHLLSDGSEENKLGFNAQHETLTVRGDNFPTDAVVSFIPPAGAPNGSTITAGSATVPVADSGHQKITLTDVSTTGANVTGTWHVTVSSATAHATSAQAALPVDAAPVPTGVAYPDAGAGVTHYGAGAQNVRFNVLVDHTTPFVAGTGTTPHTQVSFASLPAGTAIVSQDALLGGGTNDNIVRVTLNLPENASVSDSTFAVRNPDGGRSATCDNSTILASNTCVLSVLAGPHVSSISPNTEAGGFAGSAVITGTNFRAGANNIHVRVGPGNAPFYEGNITRDSATQVTVPSISIPLNTNPADVDVLVINNDDRGTNTGVGIFHVANLTAGAPSPNQGTNDAPASVTITGTQIAADASVSLVKVGVPSVPGTNVVVNNAHTIMTATFDLTNKAPGAYDLLVTNPEGGSNPGTAGCAQCFTVLALPPSIGTVTPSQLGAGATNELITITGTHIFPGATMTFSNAHVHLVGTPTVTTPGSITQHISVDEGTTADPADTVKVTNTDGQLASQIFAINAGPHVTSIAPTSRAAGSPPFTLTVHGSGFSTSGAGLVFSDGSINASNIAVNPAGDTLTAQVTIPAGVVTSMSPVPVHVTVVNADHGRGTSPADLTVDPQPTVDHFSPASAPAGTTFTLHIFGANFLDGATVTTPDVAALTITDPVFVNAGEVDATVEVAGDATKGNRTVTVTNPDAGAVGQSLGVFTKPTAPTALNLSTGHDTLQAAWAAPADNGGDAISSYTARLTKHGDASPSATFTSPDASTLSHTFTGLTSGQLYDVSVVATNGAGDGAAATGSGTPKWVTTLTIHRSAGRVTYGHAATLSGRLTRADNSVLGGVSVRIFRKYAGGTSHKIATVTTNGTGHWTLSGKPSRSATYHAVFPGNGSNQAASSPTTTILVATAVTITSPKSGSSSSSAAPLTIRGHVAPGKAGQVVRLYQITATGRKLITTATLTPRSRFRFSVNLSKGTWHLVVTIAGSPANSAGHSATLKVKRT